MNLMTRHFLVPAFCALALATTARAGDADIIGRSCGLLIETSEQLADNQADAIREKVLGWSRWKRFDNYIFGSEALNPSKLPKVMSKLYEKIPARVFALARSIMELQSAVQGADPDLSKAMSKELDASMKDIVERFAWHREGNSRPSSVTWRPSTLSVTICGGVTEIEGAGPTSSCGTIDLASQETTYSVRADDERLVSFGTMTPKEAAGSEAAMALMRFQLRHRLEARLPEECRPSIEKAVGRFVEQELQSAKRFGARVYEQVKQKIESQLGVKPAS
jgi:hypothetical protein